MNDSDYEHEKPGKHQPQGDFLRGAQRKNPEPRSPEGALQYHQDKLRAFRGSERAIPDFAVLHPGYGVKLTVRPELVEG